MSESKTSGLPKDWLNDLPEDTRVEGYKPEEMIPCANCSRKNPPNRLDCMYCGIDLDITEEQSRSLKPLLRKTESWKNAANIILTGKSPELSDDGLRTASKMLRIEPADLKKIVSENIPLPLARSEQESEIAIVVERLTETGLETRLLYDNVFEPEIPAIRLRTFEIDGDVLNITLFSDGTIKRIERSGISHIVVGALFQHRVESTERHKRKKDQNDILETAETSEDEIILDIFTSENSSGFRIAAKSFDFSFLGDEKKMVVNQNMKTVIEKLRSFAPDSRFDDNYSRLRPLLSLVWEVQEHTDSKGLKRRGFGGYNREMVTTSNNNGQFTKYSRLQRHLG
ncbi:MAG: hypothetical protein R2681_03060 [Pyrinomonadaceae bacterium]